MPHIQNSVREKLKIRAMRVSDFNYIINSWLKTYKYSGPSVRRMRDKTYFECYEPIVKKLIKKSDIYIACDREEEDLVVGYLVIEPKTHFDIIHFINVKDAWQKMGIATYLIEAAEPKAETYFTHWTSPVQSLIHKIKFEYNPFLLPNMECLDGRKEEIS